MRTITRWSDLQPYGIETLTGEACAFGTRLLCDVSAKGANLVRELFGLPPDAALNPRYNTRVGHDPSVASIMLGRDSLPDLAVFCLLYDGAEVVVLQTDGDIVGFYPGDRDDDDSLGLMDFLQAQGMVERTFYPKAGPHVGSRMIHQASGRCD